MKKISVFVAFMFILATSIYSQNTNIMRDYDESVKTYPKTFSHIGITVPNIEEAVDRKSVV